MRIDIIKQIDETNRYVYRFTLFTFYIVFTEYTIEEKVKRTWFVRKKWDIYDKRDSTVPMPILPQSIRDEAINKVSSYLSVKTWDEYKQPK